MSTLKNFIVSEELKVNHAERYVLFVERYHHEVLVDLKRHLEKAWGKLLPTLLKAYPIHPEALQDAQFRNPSATAELKLVTKPEKITSSRVQVPINVEPSLKVPLVYGQEERALIIKRAIEAASDAFKATAEAWGEIFKVEKQGRSTPWFKILVDKDEVRFQLSLDGNKADTYKTLYAVRLEYGKVGTKTRDFDRLYLYNLIKE